LVAFIPASPGFHLAQRDSNNVRFHPTSPFPDGPGKVCMKTPLPTAERQL